MNLSELEIGQNALVTSVEGEGALRQHFLDMGLIPGSRVTLVKYAPMGDPMELRIHGYELTLRIDEAKRIRIEDVRDTDPRKGHAPAHAHPGHGHDRGGHGHGNSAAHGHHGAHPASQRVSSDFEPTQHPGLGEPGIFHDRKNEHPLPEGTTMRFALAGNQNSGKTTLFNQLTGSNQHVGNFPGVTVEQKSGPIRGHDDTIVVDLPGIYSLSPYSAEEVVSRSFILEEHPHAIINIVDATNIERNLYLSMQLMELGIPMVLALNMMDELIANGGSVKINLMEQMLGIPVVPISAMRNEGVDELVMHALHVAKYQEPPLRTDFCGKDDHGGAVHRCMHAVMHLIEDHAQRA
ncbi:MAG: FeoB small GTPase domain-containing protein, partial [Coriobacteriales bacterium]